MFCLGALIRPLLPYVIDPDFIGSLGISCPGEGVGIQLPPGESWSDFGTVQLTASFDKGQFLLPGASLWGEDALPTFTTSRPRQSAGARPAGVVAM